MLFTVMLVFVTLASFIHYLTVSRYQGMLTADGIFVFAQWIFVGGTLVILDPHDEVDVQYSMVVTVPTLIYLVTSIGLALALRKKYASTTTAPMAAAPGDDVLVYRPSPLAWLLLGFSVFVTVGYYSAVGYNVFTMGLENLLSGQGADADYTTLRIQSYSGSQYFFPGYVNQFKNIILPSLAVVIIYHLLKSRRSYRGPATVALIGVALFGLLGTGQRGAFILFCLSLGTFLYYLNGKRINRRVATVGVAALPVLVVATVLLGRSGKKIEATNDSFGRIQIVLTELFNRFVYTNQYSGVAAFHYTYDKGVQNGGEWLQGLLGILPGNSGSPLAHDVFASIYGSTRGTAPPSLWGSVHYNFGFVGLIVIPVLLAFVYRYISSWSSGSTVMNSLELIGMSGVYVIAGTWVATGPSYLLNSGAVTFLALWLLGHRERVLADRREALGRLPRPRRSAARRPAASRGREVTSC